MSILSGLVRRLLYADDDPSSGIDLYYKRGVGLRAKSDTGTWSVVGGAGGGKFELVAGLDSTIPINSTRYVAPGFSSLANAVDNRSIVIPFACTISRLYVRTSTAQPSDDGLQFRVFKNGAVTAIVKEVSAGQAAGTYSELTLSASFAAGDLLSVQITNFDTTAVSANIVSISMQVTPT